MNRTSNFCNGTHNTRCDCTSTASMDCFWSCAKSVFIRGILCNKSTIHCPPVPHRNLWLPWQWQRPSLFMTRYFWSILSEFPCFHTLLTAQLQKLLCTGWVLWAYLFQASFPAQLFSLEIYRKMPFELEKKHLTGDIKHVNVLNLLSHAICCSSHNTWSITCLC